MAPDFGHKCIRRNSSGCRQARKPAGLMQTLREQSVMSIPIRAPLWISQRRLHEGQANGAGNIVLERFGRTLHMTLQNLQRPVRIHAREQQLEPRESTVVAVRSSYRFGPERATHIEQHRAQHGSVTPIPASLGLVSTALTLVAISMDGPLWLQRWSLQGWSGAARFR